jgi:hypothetical protein
LARRSRAFIQLARVQSNPDFHAGYYPLNFFAFFITMVSRTAF